MSILNVWPTYRNGEPIGQGDWVRVQSREVGVWHQGIVTDLYRPIGLGVTVVEVAHNMKVSGVGVTSIEEFADGNEVFLVRRADSDEHIGEILDRVNSWLDAPYNLFAQNCEHFASFAYFGKAESKSINFLGGVALLGLGLVVAANMQD